MTLKDLVKGQSVHFKFFRDNELYYETTDGFLFTVPINDVGKGVMKRDDKAIYYMRWIRKQLEAVEEAIE